MKPIPGVTTPGLSDRLYSSASSSIDMTPARLAESHFADLTKPTGIERLAKEGVANSRDLPLTEDTGVVDEGCNITVLVYSDMKQSLKLPIVAWSLADEQEFMRVCNL
jgi:hypothetical protein